MLPPTRVARHARWQMEGASSGESDGELPPGTHLQLLHDDPREGPGWWNAIVESHHPTRDQDGVAMVVRTGPDRLCVDPHRMRFWVELTRDDLETQIFPGWRMPASPSRGAVANSRSRGAAPAPASGVRARRGETPARRSGATTAEPVSSRQSRAVRRQEYLNGTLRRHRERRRRVAEAVGAALARPRQGTPRHMLWLAARKVVAGTAILWDICSGPHKSMALAAEDAVEGMQAFTLDCDPVCCPDVTARFEDWDPFGFMLAYYTSGEDVVVPYHFHFSPPCSTFCVQTQGLHGRSRLQPGGDPLQLPGAAAANRLVAAIAEFARLVAELPGSTPTFSVGNPAGTLWECLTF